MRRPGYVNLIVGVTLILLSTIVFLSRPGALDSEKTFDAGLHNSLYYLDLAKWQWVEQKQMSEQDVPTMEDLRPYLGDWSNSIKRFVALGIDYEITSTVEPQSDIASLSRDLSFRRGFCRFYPAGTRYCIRTGWAYPKSGSTSSFRAFYITYQHMLALALCVLGVGNLFVFVMKKA